MTAWILTDDTNELISRSITRSAVATNDAHPVNLRDILDSPLQPDPSVLTPSALEGSEPLLTIEDELIDSFLLNETEKQPVLRLKDKDSFENQQTERFTSLREELSKAEGKPMRIEFDPTDVLG